MSFIIFLVQTHLSFDVCMDYFKIISINNFWYNMLNYYKIFILNKKLMHVRIILSNTEQQMTNQTHLTSERINHWAHGSVFTNKASVHLPNKDLYHRYSNSGPPFSSFGPSRGYGMDLCLEVYLWTIYPYFATFRVTTLSFY